MTSYADDARRARLAAYSVSGHWAPDDELLDWLRGADPQPPSHAQVASVEDLLSRVLASSLTTPAERCAISATAHALRAVCQRQPRDAECAVETARMAHRLCPGMRPPQRPLEVER